MLLLAVLVGGGALVGLLEWSKERHLNRIDTLSAARLELYTSTLDAALQRFDYLPFILSRDPSVRTLLYLSDSEDVTDLVNEKLEEWQGASSAGAIFIMNEAGVVLASSNWRDAQSFVGRDYHFRPYFQDAMGGQSGRFFAIGATTGQPGLFLSYPIRMAEKITGVAVVKVDLALLERDWAAGGENLLVTDADGIVFLSSNPDWKYRSLGPLDADTRAELLKTRKYLGQNVGALSARGPQRVSGRRILHIDALSQDVVGGDYHLSSVDLQTNDWTLHYLSDLAELDPISRNAIIMGVLIIFLLAASGALVVQQRQLRLAQEKARRETMEFLEQRVGERTRDLDASNQRLKGEIEERKKAENELRLAQDELIQAAKLAALGEMSAGIVHEINQPLSAMQTFLASTQLLLKRQDIQSVESNLGDIEDLVRRMSGIVAHLKGFASKSKGELHPVAVKKVVDSALMLMGSSLRKSAVELDWSPGDSSVQVEADEILLEQILVNLIRNALDAMRESDAERRLRISAEQASGKTAITVSDTGPGISEQDLPKVFDPFFTTKEVGDGMGLGLSVSFGIAQEMGGELRAGQAVGGGAEFTLILNSAAPHNNDRESS